MANKLWLWCVCVVILAASKNNGASASENSSDLVTDLPGQPKVNFSHYSGYVEITPGRSLFYWFFEAVSNKQQNPLLLWLNGGPGCSSVGYGSTQEIGPFLVRSFNVKKLTFNPYSWNNEANILFVESPVGVGFSYSNKASDYDNLGDNITASDTYTFLGNWLRKYPEFKKREFYIGGESYAGKYVTELAEEVVDSKNPEINLKGFLVGNAEIHDGLDKKGIIDYAWSHAIISDQTYNLTKNCSYYNEGDETDGNCNAAFDETFKNYDKIDKYSIYTPTCLAKVPSVNIGPNRVNSVATKKKQLGLRKQSVSLGFDPCLDHFAQQFYNRVDVQKALHVINDKSPPRNWSICNLDIFDNWKDSRFSVIPLYQKLIGAGLRIWVYSGDVDGRVPVLSSRYSLSLLELPTTGPWRPWYYDSQVAGWVQEYRGLTFATFRGAGHDVPSFTPAQSLLLFKSFLEGQALPSEH